MIADWSVEATPESPRIVVPWEGWRDLRQGWQAIAEAELYAELQPLLRLANQAPTFTSKVDVFPVTAEEADPEIAELGEMETLFGYGSYLDLLLQAPVQEFAAAEHLARQIVAELRKMEQDRPQCAEIVVRPAVAWGCMSWGWTLYAMGFGPTSAAARKTWAEAAESVLRAARKALTVGE